MFKWKFITDDDKYEFVLAADIQTALRAWLQFNITPGDIKAILRLEKDPH